MFHNMPSRYVLLPARTSEFQTRQGVTSRYLLDHLDEDNVLIPIQRLSFCL